MTGLCCTQPPEYWDTGDDGNRLALALCRVCPVRRGEECAAGEPDPRPTGVIRAGVAFNERGGRCGLCACGRPITDLRDPRRPAKTECLHCRLPKVRDWKSHFGSRKQYFATYYRRRKTAAVAEPTREETRAA